MSKTSDRSAARRRGSGSARSSPRRRRGHTPRAGFTLIEVAFSLLLVSVGVVSVLLILPMAVTAQVRSRQQTMATAIAVHLVDSAYNQPLPKWLRTPTAVFRSKHTITNAVQPGDELGDYHIPFVPDFHFIGNRVGKFQHGPIQPDPAKAAAVATREENYFTVRRYSTLYPDPVVHAPDLETIVNTHHHGIFAVPTSIARRIDSQGDEIRKILDLGGHLYFIGPRSTDFQPYDNNPVANRKRGVLDPVPDEVQNLVFAVVGFPQRNAELFCMEGMFPGYVDLRQNFPRAIRIYPPTIDTLPAASETNGADPILDNGMTKQASVMPPAPILPFSSAPHFGQAANPVDAERPTVHFDPAERCRQIVFWRVDWRSYSDCENVTLAEADRYRYPVFHWKRFSQAVGQDQKQAPPDLHDPQYFRAERWFTYPGDSSGTIGVGGDSGYWKITGADLWEDLTWGNFRMGVRGGDLNGNRILDRGPVDPSRRLRADQVTRFNFYDPRVWLTMNKPLPADL